MAGVISKGTMLSCDCPVVSVQLKVDGKKPLEDYDICDPVKNVSSVRSSEGARRM